MPVKNYTTTCSYKAAYLLLLGAELADGGVVCRIIAQNKFDKKGFKRGFIFHFKKWPKGSLEAWSMGDATVNIIEFKASRLKLKKLMHKIRQEHYEEHFGKRND